MKTIFTLTIIVIIVIIIWTQINLIKSRICVKTNLQSVSLAGLSFDELIQLQDTVDLNIRITIENRNGFSITMTDPVIKLYYQNVQIAESVNDTGKKISLLAGKTTEIDKVIRLKLSRETILMYAAMKSGNHQNSIISYSAQFSVFGTTETKAGTYDLLS